ncbi:hypothetical protein OGAPHI_003292 [Ogataea philodendri]|uniref:Proteasome-interacting protein CIC1 n=2 Tax=Ogataea TaxID=461281 RepID=A0A9P8T5C2_9ASCO|nr:uncharacterized protein OGAPHI_003292 [Ogataea philodendri]KAH3666843.1 hypothetical protein OGAPHI_003292 [Ogataea philodendri]
MPPKRTKKAASAIKKGKKVVGEVVTPKVADEGFSLNEKAVKKAVSELIKWKESSKSDKPQLFDDDDDTSLYLQLTSVKFFNKKQGFKPSVVAVPHPVYDLENDFKVCLIVKDGQISAETLAKIEAENIPHLSKIIAAQELKGEYKSYEARRKLHKEYDLFLSDESLITALPKLLGKIFYSTPKLPLPIRLTTKDNVFSVTTLSNQISKMVNSIHYVAPMGVNLTLNLGSLHQPLDHICANIQVLAQHFKNQPLKTVQLKLLESPGLPIYVADQIFSEKDVAENETDEPKSKDLEVRLSKFEKGLVELALDEEQVDKIVGRKQKKVDKLKKQESKRGKENQPGSAAKRRRRA